MRCATAVFLLKKTLSTDRRRIVGNLLPCFCASAVEYSRTLLRCTRRKTRHCLMLHPPRGGAKLFLKAVGGKRAAAIVSRCSVVAAQSIIDQARLSGVRDNSKPAVAGGKRAAAIVSRHPRWDGSINNRSSTTNWTARQLAVRRTGFF